MRKRRLTSDEALALLNAGRQRGANVSKLCRDAGVSRDTFYRLRAQGEAGLRARGSRNPSHHSRIDEHIEGVILTVTEAHPEWTKERVADEISEGWDGWDVGRVSATGVRQVWTDVDGRSLTTRHAREAWVASLGHSVSKRKTTKTKKKKKTARP